MINTKRHGFDVECEHCLYLDETKDEVHGFVTVQDVWSDREYRLEFKVILNKDDQLVHEPIALRDMDNHAEDILPQLTGETKERFHSVLSDINESDRIGNQGTCPRQVHHLKSN